MEDELSSTDGKQKMSDDDKPASSDPQVTASDAAVMAADATAVRSCSDLQVSSEDDSLNGFPKKREASLQTDSDPEAAVTSGDQPRPLCVLLPPISRSPVDLRTSAASEPGADDLCAAVLLACLFCRPLDCCLSTLSCCGACARSLCTSLCTSLCASLCGCDPAALQPLLDAARGCDLCGAPGLRCLLCDCPVCDACLPATECLDLAMELSQMLYK